MKRIAPVLLVAALNIGTSAVAEQKLSDVGYVTEGLIAVGIAYEISEVCESISPRTLRGLSYLNQLRSHAKGLGFSNAEISAYTDDRREQDRLEEIARKRLENMGAKRGDAAAHCAVGRAEIANGTTIGYLLR